MQTTRTKIKFIRDFIKAKNASDGSKVDANANVTVKDMAVLEAELVKPDMIELNRALICDTLRELYGEQAARDYLQDLEEHIIYTHDETSLKPYCASISLYPFLLDGTKNLGGVSKAPKNLQSFCGSFVNLVYQVASNFAGAIATVEFLMYFDYFANKTYGAHYLKTNLKEIKQELQGVVYALNQPASARGNQSVFWNISIFDKYYFEGIFGEFFFPDGTQPCYEAVQSLQKYFMEWFREERKQELLTFPVVTAAMLIDVENNLPKDKNFEYMCACEMSKGHSFFIYQSTSADSLSSCCRLRNELADNEFSYTLGAGGVSTGSFQVITINLNRLMQLWVGDTYSTDISRYNIHEVVKRVHKYIVTFRKLYQFYIENDLLPAYTAGYISLDKQFGTIGINGMLESYEYFKTFSDAGTVTYTSYCGNVLKIIKDANKKISKEVGFRFNTEFVPAENLGIKNAKWDREDGLFAPRTCYNSYFFPVEDTELSVLDKLKLHGEEISQYLDGGAACHLNLEQIPSYNNSLNLIRTAARLGVPYWTYNVRCTICNDCGYINPETTVRCVSCNSNDVDYGTRIIGYLKRIKNFSSARQKEEAKRGYAKDVIL